MSDEQYKILNDKTYISKQMAPALLRVAFFRIARRGVAAELIVSLILPVTRSKQMRKIAPVTVPIPTQAIIILGPSMEGFGISANR